MHVSVPLHPVPYPIPPCLYGQSCISLPPSFPPATHPSLPAIHTQQHTPVSTNGGPSASWSCVTHTHHSPRHAHKQTTADRPTGPTNHSPTDHPPTHRVKAWLGTVNGSCRSVSQTVPDNILPPSLQMKSVGPATTTDQQTNTQAHRQTDTYTSLSLLRLLPLHVQCHAVYAAATMGLCLVPLTLLRCCICPFAAAAQLP